MLERPGLDARIAAAEIAAAGHAAVVQAVEEVADLLLTDLAVRRWLWNEDVGIHHLW